MIETTVLIADDDKSIRNLYLDAFTASGIKVLTASDGIGCVEQALKHHPDAILVDIMMPEMNGHEAVSKIRLDEWGKTAKIVYLTNLSDAENVVHAIEQGTEEYIVKANTSPKEVINKVRLAMHT
ncbi:response regulator [Candidatus Nomurabacteria bacterium]|nr:response regulator [Candidatus Kaiserbacteria bacterium]MCB9813783.1 response regulator [Candidatus Nomurabacteria bacterium]